MQRFLLVALACLMVGAGGAILTGCGGGGSSSGGAQAPQEQATSEEPAADSGASGTVEVSMKNVMFLPQDVKAKVGQKITWTNNDSFAHTVTARSGAKFDSGDVNGGATYSFTPTKAGKIAYVCTIHPGQDGTITVTK